MNNRSKSRRAGTHNASAFTIIEVLATLALTAIVLPAIVEGISLSLATAGQARQRTEAAWLAQSKLAELVAAGELHDSQLSGDFGPDWPAYRWSALISEWEDDRLNQLDVSVSWTSRSRERSVTLTTLVYEGTSDE